MDNVVEQVPVSEHKDEINNKDSSSFFNDYDDDSFESEVSIFDNGFGKDLVNNDENQGQKLILIKILKSICKMLFKIMILKMMISFQAIHSPLK